MQLIGKGGTQDARRQRHDAYPKDREHHGKGLTDGRDRRNVSVAHARQRNDSPIHRTRHGVELLRLHGMLELVDDGSGEDRNQDRDEHRCRERSFLTLQYHRKCGQRGVVPGQLQYPQHSQHPYESQIHGKDGL